MLTDIGSRNQNFCQRDRIIWEEVKLKIVFGVRICIDDAGDVDDQANGELGNIVCSIIVSWSLIKD